MSKPTFVMLVGLPGSGKSTYTENKLPEFRVHSSDAIREELLGDVNCQTSNEKVFSTLHKRIKEDLKNGFNVVCDATNISWKRRKAFVQELSNIDCHKECHLIATPYEVCLLYNNLRERNVPEDVIERMYKHFDIPYYNEGWDNIEIVYNDERFLNGYCGADQFIYDTLDFAQDNSHHKMSLGHHCITCSQIVMDTINENPTTKMPAEVVMAAMLHDCGKPFVKAFVDAKGNPCEEAHYYNHENVGAYNSLFYDMKVEGLDRLYIAMLIRWHMLFYHLPNWKEVTQNKYKEEFSKYGLWEDLEILHIGDKTAH